MCLRCMFVFKACVCVFKVTEGECVCVCVCVMYLCVCGVFVCVCVGVCGKCRETLLKGKDFILNLLVLTNLDQLLLIM